MTGKREDLIRYRMARGRETLDEARIMAKAGHWNACVNRLYYACFYAVNALLARQGLSTRKHTGVRSLLNMHFVKPGVVSTDLASLYNDLFVSRTEGDYRDFVRLKESTVRPWIPQAEAFIQRIEEILGQEPEG